MGAEIISLTLLLLYRFPQARGGDVAVIMGGYSDPSQATTPYSQTEFFAVSQDSCVYSQEFSNISSLFNYPWAQSNSQTLMGVYVESQGIFACPGDCVHLGSSRLPDTAWLDLPCRTSNGMPLDCDRTDCLAVWQNNRGFLHFSKEANIFNHNTLVYTASDEVMDKRTDIYMNSKNIQQCLEISIIHYSSGLLY